MIISDIILLLFCLTGAAFFEGMETGVISLNRMRLRHLAEQGDKAARILQNFMEHPDRLLGTTLVGTNLFIVMASVISANRGSRLGEWGEAIAGITTTLLALVFSQYLPKAWFQSRPLKRCRPFAIPLRWSALMLRPFINIINWLTAWIIPSGGENVSSRPLVSTKDEINVLAQESEAHGTLSPRQRIMIRRVLELSGKKARDIMTPRSQMITLFPHSTVSDLVATLRQSAHPRLPVCEPDGRIFRGTINFFDVMAGCEDCTSGIIDKFVRPPLFISEDTPIMEIFSKLRLSRQAMCLVINAQSDVTGLITNQNILQEIVGKL
jgi:CBS domain containing-hemolysin-like protein